jgi:hypothetical protein
MSTNQCPQFKKYFLVQKILHDSATVKLNSPSRDGRTYYHLIICNCPGSEVLTAVDMKRSILWDLNKRFWRRITDLSAEYIASIFRVEE